MLRLLTREQWGAAPPTRPTTDRRPADGFDVIEWHHFAVPRAFVDLAPALRSVQNHHTRVNGWFDGFYHFVIHRTGVVGEMRSLDWSHGSQLDACVIAFAGDYRDDDETDDHDELTFAQKASAVELAEWLWSRPGIIEAGSAAERRQRTHRDRTEATADPSDDTACPGNQVQAFSVDPEWWNREPVELEPGYPEPWGYSDLGSPFVDSLAAPGGGAWLLAESGHVYAIPNRSKGGPSNFGAPGGQSYWLDDPDRKAAQIRLGNDDEPGVQYVVLSTAGETYHYPTERGI